MSGDRKSFSSRTPVNDNPDQVEYRRGFVTRHQVSGWRFLMRRIASGVALHDTRMLVDPLRTQSRSVLVGGLVLVTGLAGCFVFSLIRPGGVAGTNVILADRDTSALYVRVGDQLHPVLNLTSARLIAGRPDNPTTVPSAELDKFPRGSLIGIPGAPERMVPNTSRDADWTVCDAVTGAEVGVTLIAGPLAAGGARAAALSAHDAVLVRNDGTGSAGVNGGSWLLWDGKRSAVDIGNRAVTAALGLGANGTALPTPRPIAGGLFNTIPESAPLTAPAIANAGQPTPYPMPAAAPVGAVITAITTGAGSDNADNSLQYYAVLDDGLQPISPVVAAMLRNTDSYGLDQPPRLSADQVARIPVSTAIDTAAYPERPVTVVDAAKSPLTCARWAKHDGATTNSLTLLAGATLPLPDGAHGVALAGPAGTAQRVVVTPGTGYFVQATGQTGMPTLAGYWISDTGVRYGISTEGDAANANRKTPAALGLTAAPLPVPWSILSQFTPGPTLSRDDALQVLPLARPAVDTVLRENP
ncbi:type VII secretion protein EccB [Mycobacterium sp. CBMA 234]|uniref:type VII secretion protein EccB n=1 Tax=Mycolicibacterium sp. CBMA 234 TaxID=1918495 RepID=UPI0012DE9358|nr:type VII secretion protein EccB [Mycolicibacterium sp. CBMA 234]MUL64739.1 type VII secretion protein EccB [Mycolicibacterium sp. CBMA 234]